MRVFVTGATGFIGEAVVRELQEAGHRVVGLARSDAAAARLAERGAEVHRGELADPAGLAAGAAACDGVVHLAFIHDFSQYQANAETDRRALAAMADALAGSGRPLVATSGTALLAPGRVGTEADAPDARAAGYVRSASEAVLAAAERGVRVSVVRLPPTVHGAGDRGFVPALVGVARRTGVSAYVGDGANRWPAVHRADAVRLFRLALEGAEAGARLHGVAEEGVPVRAIAEAIGLGLGVPVQGLAADAARAQFDWLAEFLAVDNSTSSARTRAALGWAPEGPGLLSDLRGAGYFT